MKNFSVFSVTFFISCLVTSFFFHPTSSAQVKPAKSNCLVTQIDEPDQGAQLPEGCSLPIKPIAGIQLPPDLKDCFGVDSELPGERGGIGGDYCQLPPAAPASVRSVFYSHGDLKDIYEKRMQSNKWQDWGSKEMIGVLYTVAVNWKQKYPQGHLIIMDITSDYHIEHIWGVAADIAATTNGHDCVASNNSDWRCRYGPNNLAATIELGKMIVDTGYFNAIWHSDTRANAAIFAYAHNKDPQRYPENSPSFTGIRPVTEPHWDHFHLLIDRTPARTKYYYTNFTKSKLQKCGSLQGEERKVCFP